ncbi:putative F-box/LRR-repeat protein 23 [Corylus avellana]|uniref:putative F-box/LRR-repeat protein 23 n=1 Tax=Corylus avellana TaxID=13451 RepID=UPI001E2278FD|nr:putative F-box/LRR-repeat protein 23 [Corylus avellana]
MDPPPHPSDEFRNWLELPRDLTKSILLRLGAIEILTSAQWVCSPWRKLCKDPSMWLAIDMRKPGDHWTFPELEKMCRDAVDRSCGQLVDIKVDDFGTDELLRHIADSSSQLKRLRLANCLGVSDGGLSGVAAKLPLLEELAISYCPLSKEALEAVGRCCPLLKSLQFNNWFRGSKRCHEEALAIAENMSKLRCLNLVGTYTLTNDSLQAILDGCPHLESLDLRRCKDLTLEGNLGRRCAEQIKDLRLPHDSIDDYEFKEDICELRITGTVLFSPHDYDFDFGSRFDDADFWFD